MAGSRRDGDKMQALLDELEKFLAVEVPRHRQRWGGSADTGEALRAWQAVMAESRWAAPAWPSEYGGRDAGVMELLAIEEATAVWGLPLPGILGIKNVAPTLIAWGTDEQKEYLPHILTGEHIWSQGFSEPGAGSDLASLRTRAVADGDDFVVNGQKVWTTGGHHATHMELLARTDPDAPKHKGISVFLVDLSTPGITRRPIRQINREEGFGEVFFDNVRIPRQSLLGPANQGWTVTRTTLGYERSGAAVFAARLAKDVRELIDTHSARERSQPLDPLLRNDLISCYIEAGVLSMLSRRMIARLAAGEQPGPAQTVIKLVFSEVRQRVAATRFELEGLDGVAADGPEPPGTHEYLSARSATIAAGTSQIVRNILAERVLGLPRH
jgi:alkylation response protein AidB-like acyl-CoA dehydrogenase